MGVGGSFGIICEKLNFWWFFEINLKKFKKI